MFGLPFALAADLRQVKQAQCSVLQAHTLSISEYVVPNDDIGDELDVDLDGVEPFQDPIITRPERRVRVFSNEFTVVRNILALHRVVNRPKKTWVCTVSLWHTSRIATSRNQDIPSKGAAGV